MSELTTPYQKMSEESDTSQGAPDSVNDKSTITTSSATVATPGANHQEGGKKEGEDRETLQLLVPRLEAGGAPPSLWATMTREGRLVLLSLFLVQVTDVMCLSILAPFFPKEASHDSIACNQRARLK